MKCSKEEPRHDPELYPKKQSRLLEHTAQCPVVELCSHAEDYVLGFK